MQVMDEVRVCSCLSTVASTITRLCKWQLSQSGEEKHRAHFVAPDGRIMVSMSCQGNYGSKGRRFCEHVHVLVNSLRDLED